MSYPNYQEHAILFFNTIIAKDVKYDTDIYYAAEKYILKETDVSEKYLFIDTVTLLSVLKDKGLIKFWGYTSMRAERYSITDDGLKYLESLKR